MKIIEVSDKLLQRQFLDVVDGIYQQDEAYVRPLDSMIQEVFDPKANTYFNHGNATRFVLIDENEVIGRVAAFVNNKKANGFEQPTGGLGFFECIDNKEAAFLLFDTARDWLKSQGMEAMDGPINFGENDNFWGCLVDGFTQPGFGMQYNPPYYQAFFEAYGFNTYFEQITNHLDLTTPFPERFWKIAGWVVKKDGFSFKHFKIKEADTFVDDFEAVYNDAWRFHENFTPIDKKSLKATLMKAKPFMIEELIWYAYHENKPIGFIVLFPDVNQILKHFNGKMNLWNKLRFAWMKNKKYMTRARVVILGVVPKFQRSGIESGLFWHLNGAVEKNPHIKELELSWVGDFNPKMRILQESMGATFGKKHITYRYLFNQGNESQVRASSIPLDTKYNAKSEKDL
ncbi:GNAT family N-acetyltransferase [Carboxylicivirga sp. M1479]|uniref:GNAT family N-acetyltransferase n=1 Tax=Carboxylicivirga sp. M1479 TaxID=2594476 RepID=UPI001177EBFD|nr:GNAT family N-acetyltransferase [Carboxylicivirga sp. M1479]TRX71072.1 GNAT family N-acetyltransferase [Carboxylicivirga sp. M1479]